MVAASAHEPEPGPGFSSRMQLGARAELTARRRARVASLTLATAAAVLVGGVFMTRHGHDEQASTSAPYSQPMPISIPGEHRAEPIRHDNRTPRTGEVSDRDLAAHLVRIADVDGALAPNRAWRRIEAPLAPYEQLLVTVSEGDH
jgi:hypothetical protein